MKIKQYKKIFLTACFVLLSVSFAYAHVIKSEGGNILIDPGYYDSDLKEYIKSIGGKDYPNVKGYIHNLDLEVMPLDE